MTDQVQIGTFSVSTESRLEDPHLVLRLLLQEFRVKGALPMHLFFGGPAVIWNPYYSISSQCFGYQLKLFRLDDFLVASSTLFVGLSNIFPACERVGRLLWNINFRRIFRKFNYPHNFLVPP